MLNMKGDNADQAFTREQLVEVSRVLPQEWLDDGAAVGTAAQCAAKLRTFLDAGADEILLHGSSPAAMGPLTAELRKILVDNGTPMDNQCSVVMDTAAGTKLRNLAQLQKANENGSDQLLRNGVLLDLQGLMLKESAGIATPTAGTGASYVTNGTFAVGDTAIAIDTGSGTILAGDVITFAGDTNKYVVATALTGGVVTIAAPGLRKALADGVAVTLAATATKNVAFHRRAVEIAMRAPAVPQGGDAAVDATVIQDPFSDMVFELRAYKGYRKSMFEVASAWGVKAWKTEFITLLQG